MIHLLKPCLLKLEKAKFENFKNIWTNLCEGCLNWITLIMEVVNDLNISFKESLIS